MRPMSGSVQGDLGFEEILHPISSFNHLILDTPNIRLNRKEKETPRSVIIHWPLN